MYSLEELFCPIDDFCLEFEPAWRRQLVSSGKRRRERQKRRRLSEIMTILISFQTSRCRNFKTFYQGTVSRYWQNAFPNLVSYQRFIEWIPSTTVPLAAYLRSRLGTSTGIGFIDSTSLKVGHNRRIFSHKVFNGIARRGKTSVDWFYGFKLHLVINDRGEILNVALTSRNIDDRRPVKELL